MYLIHHFIYLRPLVQALIIGWVCAWLAMWIGVFCLGAYGRKLFPKNAEQELKEDEEDTKIPTELWMILIHCGPILQLPGFIVLMSISSLLVQTGAISGKEEDILRVLGGDFFYANVVISMLPFVFRAIYLFLRGDNKRSATVEAGDPFLERLHPQEVVLWLGNPSQPYFYGKKIKRTGYAMTFLSCVMIFCTSQMKMSHTHAFYDLCVLTVCYSVPFMAYLIFRSVKDDCSKKIVYYAVTNQQLRVASFVRKGKFSYDSLKLENIDFSRTIRKREVRGIETVYYKSATKPYLDSIYFRCIQDADTVDALVHIAYDERMKDTSFLETILG